MLPSIFPLEAFLLRASKIDPTPLSDRYGLVLTAFAFAAWQVNTSHTRVSCQAKILKQLSRSRSRSRLNITKIESLLGLIITHIHANCQVTSISVDRLFFDFCANRHTDTHILTHEQTPAKTIPTLQSTAGKQLYTIIQVT